MMIVVVIIAVTAALAMPTVVQTFADKRTNEAAIEIARLGRRARSESVAYGRAHVLRYTTFSVPGSDGRIQLFRGTAGACNAGANDWVAIMASPICGAPNSMCIDEVNMGHTHWTIGPYTTRLRAPGYSPLDICFQPNGASLMRYNAGIGGRFFEGNTMGGGVQFTTQRFRSGAGEGALRRVVFPLGATPRVQL